MKIAVPVENDRLGGHFGHCPTFALYEIDEARKVATARNLHAAPPHERGVLPRWLRDLGADVVIARGMGQHAQAHFAAVGVRVVLGAPEENADAVVAKYLDGSLVCEANACDH